jgi:hypothetical protein
MSRIKERDLRSVDGLEDSQVSSEIYYSLSDASNYVRVTCNDHQWPNQNAVLEPAAARLIARHLLEQADEAELLNLEREDVPMVCTQCKCPVRTGFGSDRWQHEDPGDALACTAPGRIFAKVAAGA